VFGLADRDDQDHVLNWKILVILEIHGLRPVLLARLL